MNDNYNLFEINDIVKSKLENITSYYDPDILEIEKIIFDNKKCNSENLSPLVFNKSELEKEPKITELNLKKNR